MKTRRWIIVIALFFGFSVLVLYHGWNLIQANDKIKNYLVASLKPVLGEKFSIKSLDVSIGAIHLKGVELFFEDQYYQLQIEDVRFGFNFFKALSSIEKFFCQFCLSACGHAQAGTNFTIKGLKINYGPQTLYK